MCAQRLVCFCEDGTSIHFRAAACRGTVEWFVMSPRITDGAFACFSAVTGGFFLHSVEPKPTRRRNSWVCRLTFCWEQRGGRTEEERCRWHSGLKASEASIKTPSVGRGWRVLSVQSESADVENCHCGLWERRGAIMKTGGLWLISGNADALYRSCGQSVVSGPSLHLFWKHTLKSL